MATEKVTAILLQNLDESADTENENTKNDSQKEYQVYTQVSYDIERYSKILRLYFFNK